MRKWTLLGALVMTLAVGACATETPTKVGSDGNAGGDSSKPKTFKVGDTIQIGDLRLIVRKVVNPMPPVNEFSKPEAGNKFVAVDMEVKNVGKKPEHFSILLSAKIKNAANQAFDIDITSGKEPGPPDGEIAPGDGLRGWAVFSVPNKKEKYRLIFEADLFASGQAIVQLN